MKKPKLKYTVDIPELQKAVIESFTIHRYYGDIEKGDVVEITDEDYQVIRKYEVTEVEPVDNWPGTNTIFLKPLTKGGK